MQIKPHAFIYRLRILWESLTGKDLSRVITQEQLGNNSQLYFHSSPSGGRHLSRLLKKLDIKKLDKILDVGCGKGSALKTLAKFPFDSIAGIELSEEIASIAKSNFKKSSGNKIEIFTGDVLDFNLLENFNFFYLYNPFNVEILENFISKLEIIGHRHIIIYNNPLEYKLLLMWGYTEKMRSKNSWGGEIVVFESKMDKR